MEIQGLWIVVMKQFGVITLVCVRETVDPQDGSFGGFILP